MAINENINPNELFLELGGDIYKTKCAYYPDRTHIAHTIFDFAGERTHHSIFDKLLKYGYRRSGMVFYKSICPDCKACIPIRLRVSDFSLTKSMRKVLKKNQNTKIEYKPNSSNTEKFNLMNNYLVNKHERKKLYYEEFKFYYGTSIVDTYDFHYYCDDKLIGVGIVDITKKNASTVYFYFDVFYNKLSPGVFSILKEIEFCKKTAREYYYLGYLIKDNPKMNYKSNFKPYELLIDGEWSGDFC